MHYIGLKYKYEVFLDFNNYKNDFRGKKKYLKDKLLKI